MLNIMNCNLTPLKFVMLNPPFPLAAHLQFLRELHSNIGNVRFLLTWAERSSELLWFHVVHHLSDFLSVSISNSQLLLKNLQYAGPILSNILGMADSKEDVVYCHEDWWNIYHFLDPINSMCSCDLIDSIMKNNK